jgi:cbb3-type cytochrome oxidase maturation protein
VQRRRRVVAQWLGCIVEILLLLIPLSVLLVLLIGGLFWWSVSSGQFDDLEGPAHRILSDDDRADNAESAAEKR